MDSVAVEPCTALNTSDHVPAYAVLKVKKREKTPSDLLIRYKPKWDKCDLHTYRDFISEHLQPVFCYRLGESPEFDILYPLSHLISVLQLATRDSIPSYKAEVKLISRKQRPWSEKIQQAVKNSRRAWGEWKKAGSPLDQADPHVQKMSKSWKNLRKEQRREAASLRSQKVEHIMSEKDNSKTFFKLIKEQRKSSSTLTESLMEGNVTCTTELEICNGWAEHFQSLATPLQNESFDSKYKDQVEKDIVSISSICENDPIPIALIETDEVQRAIGKLKNNKAADTIGLTSEHLKHGGHTLVCFMTEMLNYIIQTKKVSVVLKEGLVTPIFKKGDPTLPRNYRGITVTPVILKVLEHILNHRHNKILEPTQSWLQKGFTQGCSSLNAAVILTECIQESKNTRQNLLLITLDAQKAFDVVNHNSLLRRLYIDGIQGDDWLLVKDLYTDCTSKVKWAGLVSDPMNIPQGMRQGGVLSTSHYKRYKNPLLLHLEESYSDVKIGSIKVPHITVADDLAVLNRDPGPQQVKVWDVDNNILCKPIKKHYLTVSFCQGVGSVEHPEILMAEDVIPYEQSTTHLGLRRDTTDRPCIEEKVSIGRKTAYSLMGAGFHSGNGLKVSLNGFLWSIFVLPRMIYGLEALLLRKKDFESLEKFQRKSPKQIQGLPDKTPNSVVLALLGIPPVEVAIHKNSLNLFMNIIKNKSSVEYQIAERQLAMKDIKGKSWFNYIRSTLELYNLPSAYTLLQLDITKLQWKKLLNSSIATFVENSWKTEVVTKPSLKYVNSESLKVGQSHPIWSTVRLNTLDNKRAQLKCKILTGTYILQGNRTVFNQYAVDPTCKLCLKSPETRQHFIAECPVFEYERQEFSGKVKTNTDLLNSMNALDGNLQNPETLTQLVLDASAVIETQKRQSEILDCLFVWFLTTHQPLWVISVKRY